MVWHALPQSDTLLVFSDVRLIMSKFLIVLSYSGHWVPARGRSALVAQSVDLDRWLLAFDQFDFGRTFIELSIWLRNGLGLALGSLG